MAKSLEELIILKRTAFRYLLARESKLLALGKKPVNKKIANFVRNHQENNVWSNFCDSLNEDLTRNLNVFEWKVVEENKQNRRRRYRLFSETKEALIGSTKMFSCGGRMTETPIVQVAQGQLQGKVANSPSGRAYFSFQGVPYAKPPIGSLRFKAPEPLEPWEGVREATTEGNVSAQIDFVTRTYVGDENCLFLNIYTPTLDGTFLPVMVYIHGGGFFFGSGNSDLYGPDYLIENDVVLVTINYRLGPLGFLGLNTPEVPGNAGIRDIIQALRWVKENIGNFGGNAGNLTIFGESAGGGAVSLLTASPLSKNLMNRAIIQSGTALMTLIKQNTPVENARRLAKELGADAETPEEILEFLTATPTKDIVEAHMRMTHMENLLEEESPNKFGVVIEKEFPGVEAVITEPFADLLKSGRVALIPTMIGSTGLEFAFERKHDDLQIFIPEELNIERNSETSLTVAEELKKLYFKDGSVTDREYYQLISDRYINVDQHRYVHYLLHSTNIPLYVYKFNYNSDFNLSRKLGLGLKLEEPMHMDELGYLFKNDFQKDAEPSPQDVKVRERMVRLWTNFAKSGNPTPEQNYYINVSWLPAAKDNENYLQISSELTLLSNHDQEKMAFWDNLYEKYYKVWDQPQSNESQLNTLEIRSSDPVIVETLTIVTNTSGSQTIESTTSVVETTSIVETSSGETVAVVESYEVIDTPAVVENNIPPPVVESIIEKPEVVETQEVVDAPIVTEEVPKVEDKIEELKKAFSEKPQMNGNHVSKNHEVAKRTSNEIKMVQNSNGAPKDVIRANDPPEDDLPKNIGVNKFVNFFESLGGKK